MNHASAARLHALLPPGLRASTPTGDGRRTVPPSFGGTRNPETTDVHASTRAAEPPLPAATLRSSPDPPDVADDTSILRSWAGRLDLGLPGARALVALGVAAALVAAGFLWMSRPRPEPVAEIRPSAAPLQPSTATSSAAASVVVHVAGKVRRPGVVTLPAGSRVTDAIKAAGGLRPGAKIGALNLARHVVDGEQIPVGIGGAAAPAPPTASGGAPGSAPGAQLDLNTATVEQFDQLPGVGEVLAQRIIDYRTQHGGFRSVDQLQEVTGIGEKRYAELKDLVRV